MYPFIRSFFGSLHPSLMAPKRKATQQVPVVAAATSAPTPEPSTKKKTKTVKPTQVGELVSLLSTKIGATVAQSRAFIEALRDITIEELGTNRVVKIPGLMTLKAIPLPAKKAREKIAFGKLITIAPKRPSVKIRFVATAHLLSALRPTEAAAP